MKREEEEFQTDVLHFVGLHTTDTRRNARVVSKIGALRERDDDDDLHVHNFSPHLLRWHS